MSLGNVLGISLSDLKPMSQPPAVARQGEVQQAEKTIKEQWNIRESGMKDIVRQVNSLDKGKIIDIVF